jgi:hypothetical protein
MKQYEHTQIWSLSPFEGVDSSKTGGQRRILKRLFSGRLAEIFTLSS